MKIQPYTALIGGYYQRIMPARSDIHCFTEQEFFVRPEMETERYKMLGHKWFPDVDVLIWMDGNITAVVHENILVEQFLKDADVAMFKHPERDCAYKELQAMYGIPRFSEDLFLMGQMKDQEEEFRRRGHRENEGLWETGLIIRRNSEKVNAVFERLWADMCRYHWRNQSMLPYHLEGLRVNTIDEPGVNIRNHPYFHFGVYK